MIHHYTKELLEPIVKESKTYSEVARKLNVSSFGGTAGYIAKKIRCLNIDVSHFVGVKWRSDPLLSKRCKGLNKRKSADEILIFRPQTIHRQSHKNLYRALIEKGIKPVCKFCGCGEIWGGRKLILHVDHIDGNWRDDRINNLRFLCPNCHSQTETYSYNPNTNTKECLTCKRSIAARSKSGYCFDCYQNIKRGRPNGRAKNILGVHKEVVGSNPSVSANIGVL